MKPLGKNRLQTAFLLTMGALLLLFVLLLLWGNIGGQTSVFYMEGRDFQADTLLTEEYARGLDPYDYGDGAARTPFPHKNYLPLAYLIFNLMDGLGGRDVSAPMAVILSVAAMALCAAALLLLLWMLMDARKGKRWLLAATLLLSAPSLYAFERGNIVLLSAVLSTLFLYGYDRDSRLTREVAFLALAASAALKIYPALFGLLLLFEKRWKEAARLVLYGLAFALLPFLCIEGGLRNLPLLLSNVQAHVAFYDIYTYPRYGFRLLGSLLYNTHWTVSWLENNLWRVSEWMYRLCPILDAVLSVGCVLAAWRCEKKWQKVLALTLVLINYPLNSGMYTALYLLPAVALLLSDDSLTTRAFWCLVPLTVILSPVQIALPWEALHMTDPVLCSLSDILKNLACYGLFAGFGVWGFLALMQLYLKNVKRRKHSTASTVNGAGI